MTSPHPMEQRIQRKMDALERLGSWGMQRPDVDADGYPVDDWDDDTSTMSVCCHWCQRPATWTRRDDGMPGCADHPVNKLGWERL